MMLALAAPPSCCLVLASAALPLYRAPALPLYLALVGPPGEPAACGWPVMAPKGPPIEPAAYGWPVVLPRGPPGEPAACGWPVMAPWAVLVNPLPASGLSCPPGSSC
jgi:hypothetical protein